MITRKDDKIDNAKLRRLIAPKSPLMVYNELFRDVPINVQTHDGDAIQNKIRYTATFEVRYNFILCCVK